MKLLVQAEPGLGPHGWQVWKTQRWLDRVGALLFAGWVLLPAAAGDWEPGEGFRSRALDVQRSAATGFTLLPPQRTGIEFTNVLSDRAAASNQILLSGSGVACGDVDGDGWCDLYFCGLEQPNALYRNLGQWRFVDTAADAGVACDGQFSTGAAFADVDGDGDLDLLVNGLGVGTRLFRNDGSGRFSEVSDSGLFRRFGSMAASLGDLDGNGTLDLYVGNYRTNTVRSTGFDLMVSGNRRLIMPQDRNRLFVTPDGFIREYGDPDVYYLNDGHGRFRAQSWTAGTFRDAAGQPLSAPPRDWSYSVMIRDLNGDRAPDIYVCGDFWSPDRCWINDGQGRFRAVARETFPVASSFSMGVDAADLDRDGRDEILVLDMLSPDHTRRLVQTVLFGLQPQPVGLPAERPEVGRNTLFWNRGDGTYAEIAQLSGLQASEWSWCPVFLDVDLDGYEDCLIPTGHGFDTQDADAEDRIRAKGPWPRAQVPLKVLEYPRLTLPNLAFRNRGDITFEEVGKAWGFDLNGVSQGIALADLDNDGDLDVAVNNMNSAAALLRNKTDAPRLAVRLRGRAPNTRGIGSRISVRGGPVVQSQQVICGGRFLSSDEALRVFAAGVGDRRLSVEVEWRSGRRSVINGVRANRLYEIEEETAERSQQGTVPTSGSSAAPGPFFEDVTARLNHTHHEELFDDWARQPSLPQRLSQLGPGLAWFDVNDDRRDDLIIGSGRGGKLAVFAGQENGSFQRLQSTLLDTPVPRDQTAILGWRDPDGQTVLLAGSANYEDARSEGAIIRDYALGEGRMGERFPGAPFSVGPLALGDLEGDGDLDLFVGGRVVAARYPEPPVSLLFRAQAGKWVLDEEGSGGGLARVGMVSGAVWSDLTGDGLPELVLACEWGPLRVFHNVAGRLEEVTEAWGLDRYPGWWNGVAAGDFDGDGRMDLVGSNVGRNTRYESFRANPVRLFHGDFNGVGGVEMLESYIHPSMPAEVPWRSLASVSQIMPFLRDEFPAHRAYAQAAVRELLGERFAPARVLSATWFETTLFLNRNERFEPKPLPLEAQMSPAFGISVGDFDGDGREDLFLSQNFFGVHPEDSPRASGRGLCMLGDGQGGFRALSTPESGIAVYGEQRGCATSDFDQDGRLDLAVTQNGGTTRLFRNVRATPGLRVRLQGAAANAAGVGATLRIGYPENRWGPAREVRAGGGYWSQDSAVQVLGTPETPTALRVRWPGGETSTATLPKGVRGVVIQADGKLMTE